MRLRKIAAVSTLALTAASFAALAPTTAHAATATYTCTVPLFGTPTDFEFDTATAVTPTKLAYGQSAAVKGSVSVTVPANLAELAYSMLEARSANGDGSFAYSSGTAAVTIPSTPVNETGPLVMKAPVSAGTVKGAKVGTSKITLKNYTANVSLKKADGTTALDLAASCVPKEAAVLAATVVTTKAPTTSAFKATGLKKSAKVVITVKGKFGTKPGGKVAVKVGAKTVNGTVKAGKVTVTVKGLKKGKNKVTVTYKGDGNHNGSKKAGTVKVK